MDKLLHPFFIQIGSVFFAADGLFHMFEADESASVLPRPVRGFLDDVGEGRGFQR